MAGTILQRILSRSKMPPSTPQEIDARSQQQYHFSKNTDSTSTEKVEMTLPDSKEKEILFSHRQQLMPNPRKHSYASVREDAGLTQSFKTRKPSLHTSGESTPHSRRSTSSAHKPSLVEDVLLKDVDYLTYDVDSVVIDDDSDVSPVESIDDESETAGRRPATLETLPDEILDQIFSLVQLDPMQENYLNPRVDLFSCLLTSKAVHEAALRVLYQHVTISRSKTFHKLVVALSQDPELGKLIQCLDFSHYSQMGYGRSRGQTSTTPYLTTKTLKAALSRTLNLKAFLVHEHVDDELDVDVLSLLFRLPFLQALDLCSCSSDSFVKAFSAACASLPQDRPVSSIKRLSLHECTTLRPKAFEQLLPTLAHVTHLDLAHTQVNDKALMSIPKTARITHLNLERCTQITGHGIVEFLATHPAARDSLVYLNLMADASRYRLLGEKDLQELLEELPETLRSLNLGGARVNSSHTNDLRRLATQLEELGLKGANLSLSTDITRILSLPATRDEQLDHPEWKSSLRYIDLTDVNSVTQMSLSYSPVSIRDEKSLPLEVIELGNNVLGEISKRSKNIKNPDWAVRELGRRGWYVRQPSGLSKGQSLDDGYRAWKMGARWWGMRKIPMVEQEVGGMYGYFMFKRN